jgi:hypothetical protein
MTELLPLVAQIFDLALRLYKSMGATEDDLHDISDKALDLALEIDKGLDEDRKKEQDERNNIK